MARKKVPLTPEVSARLKAHAAANKGKTNLAGLDFTFGMVGFDFISEDTYEMKRHTLYADGVLAGDPLATAQLTCFRVKKQHATSTTCPWVRLKHCQEWQVEELAKRWPSRRVRVTSYQGPNNPAKLETVAVHPLDVVVAWFKFLWPKDWCTKLEKYAVGYTDRYVHDYPGVGARLRVTEHPRLETNAEGVVEQFTYPHTYRDGFHFKCETGEREIMGPNSGGKYVWEVLG